ncbi:hypothetical protein [Derxia lacustris]|uniref:hypothetical protein n=1 Tax=Derxia lacustris TaxID=764842 RepID=UPI000A1770DA|nr:hypothetical protein [Derxia lacustris]
MHLVPAAERGDLVLEARRLAAARDAAVDLEPERLKRRRQLADTAADRIVEAGLGAERGVDVEKER